MRYHVLESSLCQNSVPATLLNCHHWNLLPPFMHTSNMCPSERLYIMKSATDKKCVSEKPNKVTIVTFISAEKIEKRWPTWMHDCSSYLTHSLTGILFPLLPISIFLLRYTFPYTNPDQLHVYSEAVKNMQRIDFKVKRTYEVRKQVHWCILQIAVCGNVLPCVTFQISLSALPLYSIRIPTYG